MTLPDRFCEDCGSKMIVEQVGAENYMIHPLAKYARLDAYDTKTGERNLVWQYRCPRRRFWHISEHKSWCPTTELVKAGYNPGSSKIEGDIEGQ